MMKKYISTLFLLGNTLLPLLAQTVPLDSIGVAGEQSRFRKETDYQTKLTIYNRLLKEPVFLNAKYANVTIGGMQRDLAVYHAQNGNVTDFKSWINIMTAPAMRRIAVTEGFEALLTNHPPADFVGLIRPQLDSLLSLQPWGNDVINQYSDLINLYLKAVDVQENAADVVNYVEPWYKAQGNYFSKDLITNWKELPDGVKGLLSYRFALALSHTGDQDKAFDVLSKGAETGAFSVDDIASFAKDFKNIPNLKARIEQYLHASSAQYATKVKALLQKNTIDGKPYDLEKMQPKYILIDFWGSWCLPCRASHPKLVEMYAKYKGKGLEIISVSQEAPAATDIMRERWKKAVTQDKMTWIQILNNEEVESFDAVKEFTIAIFPTKILLDKDLNKIEVYQGGAGAAQLESKIAELLEAN